LYVTNVFIFLSLLSVIYFLTISNTQSSVPLDLSVPQNPKNDDMHVS